MKKENKNKHANKGKGDTLQLGRSYRKMDAPLYRQVFTAVRDAIYRGDFAAGDPLPSEHSLVESMRVSRITVRRAIDELAARGLIVRAQGRETRVRADIGAQPILANVEGLLENIFTMGFRTKADVIEFKRVMAPEDAAAALALIRGTEVQMAVRVRNRDFVPFAHITTYLSPEIGCQITREDLKQQPVLALLERLGVHVTHADQSISAEAASPEVAALLQVAIGTALLKFEMRVIGDTGKPVEFARALYRPDYYRYQMTLQRVGSESARIWRSPDDGKR